MRNQIQLKSSYNRGIYKCLFVVSFIFSFSAAIGQEVIINKTAVANPNACKQFDIELTITGNPTDSPQEVVLVIDRSGSMDDAPGSQNDPIDYAQDAAIDFVNNFFLPANNPTGKNKIALVTFNSSATVNVSLSGSSSQATIISSINAITTWGSTNTADALLKADNELTTNGTFDCATSRSIILLSDGVANNGTTAIQAGVNAQTTTVQGEEFTQNIFTIGLVGAISGSDQTSALNILDGIQNAGAFSTENNADLSTIYDSILGQLVSAAKQLPGQALVSDNIQAGFSVVPGTFIASKGNAMNVGQAVSWFVSNVTNETISLKYTIVADDDSVCGTLLPGTSVINYEDSSCDIQSVEFNNPSVCVPCPEITPVISMSGCSNSIAYSSVLTQNECPSTNDAYAWEFFLNGVSIGTSNTESGVFDYAGNELFEGDFIARLTYSGTYVSGCTLPDVEEQVSLVVQNILDINIVSQSDPNCENGATGEIVVEGVNGYPPYQYSIDNGLTFQNSGTFSNLEDGVYTLQVSDNSGCSITSIDVTLLNGDSEDPIWTNAPVDMTVECDGTLDPNGEFANWLISFSGTDNSGNAIITNNSNGLSDLCGATGTETVTFTLSDDCGNSISVDAVFSIVDTTAPNFNETLPTNINVECDNIPSIETLTANDSCGNAIVTFNEVRTDGSCASDYTLTRTWTATDECGNTTVHEQTVIVEDNTAPIMNVEASNIVVECENSGNYTAIETWLNNNGGASASDSCGSVIWTNNYETLTSDCAVPVSVTFTATDECGNQTSTIATYAVQDNVAPSIDVEASDLVEECDGNGNTASLEAWLDTRGGASATDNCSDISWNNDFNGLTDECGATQSATVTFTVTDGCGNSSSTTATFRIEDSTAPTFNEALPSEVTVECDAITSPATLTASDSCGDATVAFSEVRTDGSCDSNYTLERTWTATDACGNTTTHTQTVNVQDNTAPTFNEALPSEITEECDTITSPATLTASDNCGDATVTFNEIKTDGSCDSNYTLVRTWTATDACGNTTSHTQTVNVQDNTAPTFNEALPSNITLECDAVTSAETLTATDNCGNATVTFNETRIDGACASEYLLTRTWTATDDCGNTALHTQTVTIQNSMPALNVEATNMVLACDGSGNNAAMDTWLSSHGGATVSNSCGNIAWTHNYTGQAADCSSPVVVTFTATDDCGNQMTTVASYSIQDSNAPIIEIEARDLTVECDGSGNTAALQDWLDTNGGASANDDCSAITWSNDFTALSNDCGATGSATVTFTATDGCGNSSDTTATFSIEDTTNPIFNESLPDDITVECDTLMGTSITLTASDSCGDASVTFDEVRTDGSCPSSYTLSRSWTATDACGNSTSHSQIVTVIDNTPPVFNETLPLDITIECDTLIGSSVILTATDNCGDATVVFDEVKTDGSCPSNYTLTRTWTASDDCGNTISHTQTVTVEDTTAPVLENLPSDNGNETCDEPYKNPDFEDNSVNGYAYLNEDFIIGWNTTADNGVIEIQQSGAVNNTDSFSGNFHAELNGDTASDIYQEFCTIPNAELEISFAHHKRMSGNNTTDDIVGVYIGTTPDNVQLLQTFTATSTSGWTQHNIDYVVPDGQTTTVILFKAEQGAPNNNTYGNLIDGAQVVDTTNTIIECDNIPEAANVTAIDNCDADVVVILTESTVEGTCPGSYQLLRTWTATDNCGNSSEFTQTLTIQDLTPPTFVEDLPQNENYECSDVPEAITLTAIDNCTNATVTLTETQADGNCPGAFIITRIWVASDECNNQVTHTQVIRVQDTTAPEFNEELPIDVIVECDDIPEVPTLTVTDNCGNAMLEFNEETVDGDCPSNYTITRTWTATDDCDNTAVHIQTITVQDTTAPEVISDYEEEISVSCGDIPEAPELEFEDACSSDISVSYEETSTQNASGNDYEIIREWTVSDACNNTAIYAQTVFVNADSNVGGTDTDLCNGDDIRFDLFNLLTGDYGFEGVWTVSPSNATIEDGHYFNPLGLDIGLYIFTYTDDVSACPSETMVEIELNDECIVLPCGDADEVIISKAVTANGDNINDYFTIEGIEGCGFTVQVQIYNRWGAKIYESKNYQNNWNGTSHGNSIGGSDKVPTGTYYYIINLVDSGLKPFTGPIYVGTK